MEDGEAWHHGCLCLVSQVFGVVRWVWTVESVVATFLGYGRKGAALLMW